MLTNRYIELRVYIKNGNVKEEDVVDAAENIKDRVYDLVGEKNIAPDFFSEDVTYTIVGKYDAE